MFPHHLLLHGGHRSNQAKNNNTRSNEGFETTREVLHSVMDTDPDPRVLMTKIEEEKNTVE
jgi:hypothetical protein